MPSISPYVKQITGCTQGIWQLIYFSDLWRRCVQIVQPSGLGEELAFKT